MLEKRRRERSLLSCFDIWKKGTSFLASCGSSSGSSTTEIMAPSGFSQAMLSCMFYAWRRACRQHTSSNIAVSCRHGFPQSSTVIGATCTSPIYSLRAFSETEESYKSLWKRGFLLEIDQKRLAAVSSFHFMFLTTWIRCSCFIYPDEK